MINGANVCHEPQVYKTPPQVSGIKNEAELGINRAIPMKSIFRTCAENESLPARKLDDQATKSTPIPIKGKLI
jgi:hypothetical protein